MLPSTQGTSVHGTMVDQDKQIAVSYIITYGSSLDKTALVAVLDKNRKFLPPNMIYSSVYRKIWIISYIWSVCYGSSKSIKKPFFKGLIKHHCSVLIVQKSVSDTNVYVFSKLRQSVIICDRYQHSKTLTKLFSTIYQCCTSEWKCTRSALQHGAAHMSCSCF